MNYMVSGVLFPLSQLEIVCLETPSSSANCSIVLFAFLRRVCFEFVLVAFLVDHIILSLLN